MSKHTPTPWVVSSAICGKHEAETLSIYHEPSESTTIEVIETGCICGDECISEADARHIVKCVNYHDRLVEALGLFVNYSAEVEGDVAIGDNDVLWDKVNSLWSELQDLPAHNGGEG